jgi:hypothetical protein
MYTARLELRQLVADDLDALVELDGFEAVRHVIDPFGEHIRRIRRRGPSHAGPWSYRGLPGAEYESRPGAGPHSAPAKRP